MKLSTIQFFSLIFTSLALAPALAHLLELPHKIGLARDDYFIVQQIYAGWSLLGIVVVGALVSTFLLTLVLRKRRIPQYKLALTSFICVAATQAIFWIFTFPANKHTVNWTMMANWDALRTQWEYSHAASAVLDLVALVCLIICILASDKQHQ
jgi:hypothetical protein